MDREQCREMVRERISGFLDGYAAENGIERIWREPLVGFADARSPMFPELKKICYPGHLLPQDIVPDASVVLSYFLPFVQSIGDGNADGDLPSEAWRDAYFVTNRMAAELNASLEEFFRGMGYDAGTPEGIGPVDGTYSIWSQRHIARIAGLGTFGMNNMLISESGCCGRYFSVVTSLDIEPDHILETERCRFKRDGSCGACMDRCVCGALTPDGFDREACRRVCDGNIPAYGHSICGKCLSHMPCSYRAP